MVAKCGRVVVRVMREGWSKFKKGEGGLYLVSWRFPGVVVRGDLGWVKLRTDRHRRALIYAGRLWGMEEYWWPRIVGEA